MRRPYFHQLSAAASEKWTTTPPTPIQELDLGSSAGTKPQEPALGGDSPGGRRGPIPSLSVAIVLVIPRRGGRQSCLPPPMPPDDFWAFQELLKRIVSNLGLEVE